jgi:hypothetical protein
MTFMLPCPALSLFCDHVRCKNSRYEFAPQQDLRWCHINAAP